MYNIIHVWRPTHRRSQADPRGCAPGRPSDARPRGTCEARGCWLVGGASKVRGRMGLLEVLTPHARATSTSSHEKGARELRSGLRGVWTQASAPQTASTMKRRERTSSCRPSLLRLTFRRLPLVASGRQHVGDGEGFNRAGSTLAVPCFGLENGVHPRPSSREKGSR